MARRRIYGSATACISTADCTRVYQADAFHCIHQSQGIHDRSQHAHIIGCRPIHATVDPAPAAPQVAGADHNGTDPRPYHAHPDPLGDIFRPIRVDPKTCGPARASPLSFSRIRLYFSVFSIIFPPNIRKEPTIRLALASFRLIWMCCSPSSQRTKRRMTTFSPIAATFCISSFSMVMLSSRM